MRIIQMGTDIRSGIKGLMLLILKELLSCIKAKKGRKILKSYRIGRCHTGKDISRYNRDLNKPIRVNKGLNWIEKGKSGLYRSI